MKTLDWSVETLGRECNSTELCIHFYKTRVASETWLILYLVAVNERTLYHILCYLIVLVALTVSFNIIINSARLPVKAFRRSRSYKKHQHESGNNERSSETGCPVLRQVNTINVSVITPGILQTEVNSRFWIEGFVRNLWGNWLNVKHWISSLKHFFQML